MACIRLSCLPLALVLSLLAVPACAQLPYQPTRFVRLPSDPDLLFIFGPAPAAPNLAQLRSLNISSPLDAANLAFNTLYPALPWSSSASAVPYLPVAGPQGNLTVYAGACTDPAQAANIWILELDDGADGGNGSWSRALVALDSEEQEEADVVPPSPAFLADGVAFSSSEDGSNSSVFAFGGMCPYANATQDDWQASANYSRSMLRLRPDTDSRYLAGIAPARGPPVAEAGFSLVALDPTYTNNTDGPRDQQQNFVLIGGHTQSAYINMSQIALYSLPQESWTFIAVDQPAQEESEVEPRSGHTAVLTADGSKIVVLGGWVGDIDTPASPQLAILEVGDGYGGDGSWRWTVPSTNGSGLGSDSGVYGHGAVMLPGDVMMITGGYSISSSASSLRPRADAAQSTQTLFFNTTSSAWLSGYSPSSGSSTDASRPGPRASKLALGAGLGAGLAAVLAMLIFYLWYTRCLRKKRETREKDIEKHHSGGAFGYRTDESYGNGGHYDDGIDDGDAAALAVDPWFLNGHETWKAHATTDAESSGLLVGAPSPTRGLSRSLHGRAYHQAPRYDEFRTNQGSREIHPIDEEDEIDSATNERTGMPETTQRPPSTDDVMSPLSTAVYLAKPHPLRSHPVSAPQAIAHFPTTLESSAARPVIQPAPSSLAQPHKAEILEGSPNWELVGNSASSSERTESNLSSQSSHSALSMLSARSSAASVARAVSNASAALLATLTNPFSTPHASPSRQRQADGSRIAARADGDTGDSCRADNAHLARLQAEEEALLDGASSEVDDGPAVLACSSPGSPARQSPNMVHTPVDLYPDQAISSVPPPHKKTVRNSSSETLDLSTPIDNSFATQRKGTSMLRGSVNFAFSRRPSSRRHGNSHDRAQSLTSSIVGDRSSSARNSPTKLRRHRRWGSGDGIGESTAGTGSDSANPPRRANSDALFWRSKRGSGAWSEDGPSQMWASDVRQEPDWVAPAARTPESTAAGDAYTEGEEWDVEAAAEGRVVQVMFTVPRQPLRVVNVDSDPGSGDLSDETSASRAQPIAGYVVDDEVPASPPLAATAAAEYLRSDLDLTTAVVREEIGTPPQTPPDPEIPMPLAAMAATEELRSDLRSARAKARETRQLPVDSAPPAPPSGSVSPYNANARTPSVGKRLRRVRKERDAASTLSGLFSPRPSPSPVSRSAVGVESSARSDGRSSVKDLVRAIEAQNHK